MAISDVMPPARPKKIDPKRIEAIRKGSKRADDIRKKADDDHKKNDVPQAEADLESALKNL